MQYFTLEELTRSETAQRLHLDNRPTAEAERNLRALVAHVLDPLRTLWGAPIRINSAYRSAELNRAVGGSPTSQHLKGQAADIAALGGDAATMRLGWLLIGTSRFDQLIVERADREKSRCQWLHVSYRADGQNRKQIIWQ